MSNMFGESSIVVFLAIFGGSTLLLFLLCFCCQRKLKPDNSTIEVPPEVVHANHQEEPVSIQTIPNPVGQIGSSSPPPPYHRVILSKGDQNPPDYEEVVRNVQNTNYI
ncbi:uncharacterized protein LOC111633629 isoform X2 [Centruroides sculpturatus]|uniref:uncharacterized protein LOC111633629 isoform X2 n=1 Tax=Centruroides sculpturatus TaxID=218467 RepID=UPI000C6EC186|nr:uncharacterized protein LOC111633629 isoform X2 [Centruroides sculpturatus]